MKKILFSGLLLAFGWVMLTAQQPIKERIVSSVELASSLPSSGSDAYNQCGSECKPFNSVLKAYDNRVSQWKKHFENTSTGNINMSDYTNPQVKGTPGTVEINFMQSYGDILTHDQQMLMDYSLKMGPIGANHDKIWSETMDNFMKEIEKCPSKHEGSRDEACTKKIKEKYEQLLNKITSDYIQEVTPILSELRGKIKLDNASIEDNLMVLGYGDKVSMPTTKNLIISVQGGLMALVTAYGGMVSGVWEKACGDYSEVKRIKETSY
jgi:hypothetical protein